MKYFLLLIFLLGLTYLIFPGPTSINDIPGLPGSLKSHEPGDTTQTPNIAAYFSNFRRESVTSFYKQTFSNLHFNLPVFKFNHPPEEAFTYIRDQQPSTFLEEYSYPLRDSLYVNGFEPFDRTGKSYRRGATSIVIENTFFESKTTLRFYNSSIFWRIFVYIGIWFCALVMIRIFRKAFITASTKPYPIRAGMWEKKG